MQENVLNIKQLKAVVFDWDNTLAKSKPPLVSSIEEVLNFYHLPCWDEVKTKRDNNLSFRDNFPRIFGNKSEEAYEKYREIYLKNVANMIETFPKVKEVLFFFKKRNIPLLIMTNKDRLLLEYELPILFEPETFDGITCGHEAEHDKPNGAHLIFTLKNILKSEDITPQTVWVVGDSPQDSACAKCAGALPIRIGQSLWTDENKNIDDILFFDSFVDFYKSLLLSN